jgi:CHAT domain-containing protein
MLKFLLPVCLIVSFEISAQSFEKLIENTKKFYVEGKFEEAIAEMEKVAKKQEKKTGKTSIEYARAILIIARLHQELRHFEKAEALYIEGQAIQWIRIDIKDPAYLESSNELASVYFEQGKYDKAEPIYGLTRNLTKMVYGTDHLNYTSACRNLATLYSEQARYNEAEQLYLEAKTIDEKIKGKNSSEYAKDCTALGALYFRQDHFEQAQDWFMESKEILGKLMGIDNMEYAEACSQVAAVSEGLGLFSDAEEHMIEAKRIAELKAKDTEPYARICFNLGLVYIHQNQPQKAEQLFIEAKIIRAKILGKDHPSYIAVCNELGLVYTRTGEITKAKEAFQKALDGSDKSLAADGLAYGYIYYNLAYLFYSINKFEYSEKYFLKSMEIARKKSGKTSKLYQFSALYLALTYRFQKRYPEALAVYRDVLPVRLQQNKELLPILSEKEKIQFIHLWQPIFRTFNNLAVEIDDQAAFEDVFNIQLHVKGVIFQSSQKMHNEIMSSSNDSLKVQYENWRQKRIALNTFRSLPESESLNKGVDTKKLENEINELERLLSKKSSRFAAITEEKQYSWKDIQGKLKPGEAAVEIIRTDSAYLALIVTHEKTTGLESVILPDGLSMEKRSIRFYRNCIEQKLEDDLSYNKFWKPIADKLGKASKVYLSVDGVYHQLNMLTLKNPLTKKYLFHETDVQLVSNLKDIITYNGQQLAPRYDQYKIHLVAYPKYDGTETESKTLLPQNIELKTDTSQRFFTKGGQISLLPGTKVEARNIGVLCQQFKIPFESKSEEFASESYIKSLNSPSILHIATHGFFLKSEEAKETALVSSISDTRAVFVDPLVRSGLLFANAQQGINGIQTEGEDGILTAKEALNLKLDNTDMVIMSACETGLGEIQNGEGVYGLQRAFQQAGAKTVVISLWKVSDDATQELMSAFYQNLLGKKLTKREAFRQAQLSLMRKFPPPFYWGAFVMVGN